MASGKILGGKLDGKLHNRINPCKWNYTEALSVWSDMIAD